MLSNPTAKLPASLRASVHSAHLSRTSALLWPPSRTSSLLHSVADYGQETSLLPRAASLHLAASRTPSWAPSLQLQQTNALQRRQYVSAAAAKKGAATSTPAGKVVVVESPAKAKKLQSYLGSDWTVLASFGHVRNLLSKPGSVDPQKAFAMTWAESARQREKMDPIRRAVMSASQLVLATDPDREGEAISWHILQQLQAARTLSHTSVSRITFTEVTRKAVLEAMANPRTVSAELVDAYRARLALDFLLGFNLSPVLWRKLPSARSAGRVQSVALRLVTERESEIGAFQPHKYWSVDAVLQPGTGSSFPARLSKVDGTAIGQMGFINQAQAEAAVQRLQQAALQVKDVGRKETHRSPSPPFTTSTMQQAASARLNMSPSRTMSLAQQLYEGLTDEGEGLITYMRTDGVDISPEAVQAIRGQISTEYGAAFVPATNRAYKTKAKNAQEAHAAIQPTDVATTAQSLIGAHDEALQKLYGLIRARTLACQMADARIQQVGVEISDTPAALILRATGSDVKFPGFLAAFGLDEEDDESASQDDSKGMTGSQSAALNALQAGMPLSLASVQATEHQTRPPPRYTEATLVKALEARGIGRPSTYASTIKLLQDRGYVAREGRSSRLRAETNGRLLIAYLTLYFPKCIDYGFTSDMEASLDDISGGREQWQRLVQGFWQPFDTTVQAAGQVERFDVIEAMDKLLGPDIFPAQEGRSAEEARACPACTTGRLALKTGRGVGGFVGCSNYPDCSFARSFAPSDPSGAGVVDSSGALLLGAHPDRKHNVTLRSGRYGAYVQMDPIPDPNAPPPPPLSEPAAKAGRRKSKAEAADKPRRASVPKGMDPMSVSLDVALSWLQWPKSLGEHPQEGGAVEVCTGGFGPYVRHGTVNASLKDLDPHTVTMEDALRLLTQRKERLAKRSPQKETKPGESAADSQQPTGKPKSTKAKAADDAAAAKPAKRKPASTTKAATKKGSSSKAPASKGRKNREAPVAPAGTAAKKAPPANPYLRFCQQQRASVKAEHPDLPLGQVTKLLAERWRTLSDAEREAFRNTA